MARSRSMCARPPAAGSCVGYNTARSRPPVPLPAPRSPRAPFSPLRLVASLLRRAARFFLTAGGLVGPVGRVARVARSLSLALLRVGRENFSRPCPRACVLWVCLRLVFSPSLRSAAALPLARPILAVRRPPRQIIRARVAAQEYTSGGAALAPLRSARFWRLWRHWRWFAGVFSFIVLII